MPLGANAELARKLEFVDLCARLGVAAQHPLHAMPFQLLRGGDGLGLREPGALVNGRVDGTTFNSMRPA